MQLKIKTELPRYHKLDWLYLVNIANQINFHLHCVLQELCNFLYTAQLYSYDISQKHLDISRNMYCSITSQLGHLSGLIEICTGQ